MARHLYITLIMIIVCCAGVKTIEPQAVFGHRIEVRGFKNRMIVVPRLAPTLVICHDKYDIRPFPWFAAKTKKLSWYQRAAYRCTCYPHEITSVHFHFKNPYLGFPI